MPTTDVTADAQHATLTVLSLDGSTLHVRFGGEEHEVELAAGDRAQEAAYYYCPITARQWRCARDIGEHRAGDTVTPAEVLDALDGLAESGDALQDAIDAAHEADVRDRCGRPVTLTCEAA